MEKVVRTVEIDRVERTSWARMIGDHDRIAAMCADIVALSERPPAERSRAPGMLAQLALVVADHLGAENEMVDLATLVAADSSPDVIANMQATADALRNDWRRFISRWLPAIPPAEWPAFMADATEMLSRLDRQVAAENRLLYDVAFRHGIIDTGFTALH